MKAGLLPLYLHAVHLPVVRQHAGADPLFLYLHLTDRVTFVLAALSSSV